MGMKQASRKMPFAFAGKSLWQLSEGGPGSRAEEAGAQVREVLCSGGKRLRGLSIGQW